MGQSHVIAKLEGAMAATRQIKTGADKLDFIMFMFPQQIKDGKLINFKGKIIGAFDADDQVLVEASRVLDATKVTDALMNDVFNPLNKLFGSAGERAEAVTEDNEEEVIDLNEETAPAKDIDEDDILDAIEDAVDKDDLDEAKKQLALLPKSNDEYNDMKTLVEELAAKQVPVEEPKDELIDDLEDALEDNDFEDAHAILKELGRKHPRYKELKEKVEAAEEAAKQPSEEDLIDDIEDAIDDGNLDKAKTLLEKLGEDHDEYTRLRRAIRKAGRN